MKVLIFTTTEEIVEHISGLAYVDEVLVLTYADPGNYQHFARHSKVRVCGSSNKQKFQNYSLHCRGLSTHILLLPISFQRTKLVCLIDLF